MRIDLRRRRRASLALEAVLLAPVALMLVLATRFIAEGMLTRQQIAVFTRASTVAAATSTLPRLLACDADRSGFNRKSGIRQTALVRCSDRPSERGLSRERPFFQALRDGARPAPEILRDVVRNQRLVDIQGDGTGSFLLQRPAFLEGQGAVTSRQTYLMPPMEFWDHTAQPYRNGHDRAIWQQLGRMGTAELFPRVFPAARR